MPALKSHKIFKNSRVFQVMFYDYDPMKLEINKYVKNLNNFRLYYITYMRKNKEIKNFL